MNVRELIPSGRNQQMTPSRHHEEDDPFLTLHREMISLFNDLFAGSVLLRSALLAARRECKVRQHKGAQLTLAKPLVVRRADPLHQ